MAEIDEDDAWGCGIYREEEAIGLGLPEAAARLGSTDGVSHVGIARTFGQGQSLLSGRHDRSAASLSVTVFLMRRACLGSAISSAPRLGRILLETELLTCCSPKKDNMLHVSFRKRKKIVIQHSHIEPELDITLPLDSPNSTVRFSKTPAWSKMHCP
jgi:hypothetical protein